MKWFDRYFEKGARQLAQKSGRRGALVKISRLLVGSAFVLPVLPFDRVARAESQVGKMAEDPGDDTQCDYWRYCAIDGWLCSCCGGTVSSCPPGTNASPITWIGTCRNPADGLDYIISYNDCCGVTSCGRCFCNDNVGERPGYVMGKHNDISWCMGMESDLYHCSTAIVIGVAVKTD